MFDVFYIGTKPGLFAHERPADSIQHACNQSRTRYCWIVNYLSDYTGFDFLWEPSPWQAHQRHAWASQHQKDSGTYLVPRSGYTDTNYHAAPLIQRLPSQENWIIPAGIDTHDFDFSWHPDPAEPAMIYQFGTQHQRTGGPMYRVHGATNIKFVDHIKTIKWSCDAHWIVPDGLDFAEFDFTWHPDDRDPAYIYQFGTQHQPTGGPQYAVPNATEIKYVSLQRARKISIDDQWTIPENMNREAFDWTWHPDDRDAPYRYQFPTQWNRAGGPEYCVPGATEIKFVGTQVARMLPTDRNWTIPQGIDVNSFDFSWTPDPTEPPYIYEFGTQWQKTGGPRYTVPGATEVKYVSAPRARRESRDDCWEVPEGADVESFDWTWHPDSTEQPYVYQFGTQHQRTGGPIYRTPGATEIKYVDQIRIRTQRVATAIIEIDHMDGNAGQIPDTTKTSRYFDNYLDTLRRIAKNVGQEHEFVWICSSICDYRDFDFSWHPEQWQATMLHVFASDDEKFGDTFFMHVPTFQYRSETCKLLEWYDVNFVEGVSVPRRPAPVIQHDEDTHVEIIKSSTWAGPLAVFTTRDIPEKLPVVPLWREKTKTIVPLSPSGDIVIVPKVSVPAIKEQLYDYEWIDKTKKEFLDPQPQDVIFISYDEPQADKNWEKLSIRFPRAQRVHGVAGMENALVEAARRSNTPWYFAVFAKTELADSFNFDYVPDYLQQPKHYIFDCQNTVNGLVYGHMGIVMYNCRYVLQQRAYEDLGLDYTLSFPHESVPLLSCYGKFDTSAYHTWRTAFREASKLYYWNSINPDVDNDYRLHVWTTKAQGPYAEWALYGANEGVEFAKECQGDLSAMKKSFRWEWLRQRFVAKHGELD